MQYISLAISIISVLVCVLNFFRSDKNTSKSETEKESYKQGALDTQLKNILDKLGKIEAKLDTYSKEIDERIEKQMQIHLRIYHRGEK